MNRIEEIRDETETSDSYRKWFDVEWNNRGKGAVDELIQHNEKLSANVQYLLSKLEQAEKALERIYKETENLDGPNEFVMLETAEKALAAIRS